MKSGGKRVRWWSTVLVVVRPVAMEGGSVRGREEREEGKREMSVRESQTAVCLFNGF